MHNLYYMVIFICILTILGLMAFLVYASACIRSGVYLKAVCRLETDEKVLALTFDDGPDAIVTPQLLNILDTYQIQALFFCIGHKIAGNEKIIRQMEASGHILGNHSYSHSNYFPVFSSHKMKMDILKCEQAIVSGSKQKGLSLFRPPFGVTNPIIKKVVCQLNYQVIGWDIRSFDTIKSRPEAIAARVIKKMKPGSILLFHDNIKNCPEIVEIVIKQALQDGYRFVRADKYIKQ